jgi:hypothetical protein
VALPRRAAAPTRAGLVEAVNSCGSPRAVTRNPAGLIDSETVKGADTAGRESRGHDAGKKINGRERFIPHGRPRPAAHRRGPLRPACGTAMAPSRTCWTPTCTRRSVSSSPTGTFAGRRLNWARTILATTGHVVRKPADQQGFAVIPRQREVERTAHRRLARDYERHPTRSATMIRWAATNTITRRIARGGAATRRQRWTFTTVS